VKDDVVAGLRTRAKPWMRGNRFEDFAVGRAFRHHWGRTLTAAANVLFTTLTLHYNPLYTNLDYARANGFVTGRLPASSVQHRSPSVDLRGRRPFLASTILPTTGPSWSAKPSMPQRSGSGATESRPALASSPGTHEDRRRRCSGA
jgi:hypothetical protein